MKLLRSLVALLAAVFALSAVVSADDGAINNKSMSRTIKVPTFDQAAVNGQVPEAEHAFTDFMKFYVPAQASSGLVGPVAYCDIDNQPESSEDCDVTKAVEVLDVARPLINLFIFGPQFEVDGTAFAHRWFDTYGAVSLDDGKTFKKTNLSESADQSSFNLDEDHKPGNKDPLPNDHNILLGKGKWSVPHARGYETPFTAHCSECHGSALQGTAQTPSCYSCHSSKVFKEDTPLDLGPIITKALYAKKRLTVHGENAASKVTVTLVNGETGHEIATTRASKSGDFRFQPIKTNLPPCTVAVRYEDQPKTTIQGPTMSVLERSGEQVEQCEGHPINLTDYPGGAYNVFHAVEGNKVLVAWPSRFCSSGQPAYSLTTENEDNDSGIPTAEKVATLTAIADFIREGSAELGVPALPGFTSPRNPDGTINTNVDDLYLVDAFGVAGSQGSVNFADEGYPQAGIVPFGCVWTARGILLPGDDPRTEDEVEATHMVWTKAERLTSGRRDPNRIEVKAVKDAGFVVTWQEDPEGLRPGQGLGPGEGWSGAVAHSQTDAWYSFINWEYFDIVKTAIEGTDGKVTYSMDPINILDHDLTISGRPQVFVPMAVPMRLSNNAKCNPPEKVTEGEGAPPLYCVFEPTDEVPVGASSFGLSDQCANTVDIWTGNEDGPGLVLSPICVADSGLPNRANTALTRPRSSLQGYTSDRPLIDPETKQPMIDPVTSEPVGDKSAWVIVVAEESKGLGKYFFNPDGIGLEGTTSRSTQDGYAEPCEEDSSLTCSEEIGKNIWYFSFDMGSPDTSAGIDNPNSLVSNLVNQGNMLNQAEVYWETGELYGLMATEDMQDYGAYNFDIVNTEIARRGSLLVQGIGKAMASRQRGGPGLVAMPSWKQGVMRQGGPADTMLRRIVLPYDFDPAVDNPYAFENMVCGGWLIYPGTNPYYPGGVCADPATNLSGVVPDTCLDDETGDSADCPKMTFGTSTYGIGDTNPILQGYIKNEGVDSKLGNTTRVLTWHQCPSEYTVIDTDLENPVQCYNDDRDDRFVNLLDQSWYNPLDVSKGHRGFLDGDFVMFLYAWSPNWRLNAKGHDRYELYVRRSFDGGISWTTTPADEDMVASDGLPYGGDGTVTCESYRRSETGDSDGDGQGPEPKTCYQFAAGAPEHARNVTQHKSMRITTLDPRYAISGSTRGVSIDPLTCTDGLFNDPAVMLDGGDPPQPIFTCDDTSLVQDTDQRDPSRYFMVFETGDNRTVEVGEAEPLDLFYSRAESFGDDYVVWTETDTESADRTQCYPSNPHDVLDLPDVILGSGFCNEFDRLNTGSGTHSSEASLAGNSDGSKMYAVSAQWEFEVKDDYESEVSESDAMARRVWWLDDYVSEDESYTLPGTQNE